VSVAMKNCPVGGHETATGDGHGFCPLVATKLPTGSGLIDPTRPRPPAASRGWGPSELAEPAIPPLVGYAEIAEMAGVSRQRAIGSGT
jgi:hypothetical protein